MSKEKAEESEEIKALKEQLANGGDVGEKKVKKKKVKKKKVEDEEGKEKDDKDKDKDKENKEDGEKSTKKVKNYIT